MAKRKKGAKHHKRGTRRIGAVKHPELMEDVMEGLGVLAGSLANTALQRMESNLNPKIVAGGQILGGFLIKRHFPGNALARGVGWSTLSIGTVGLAHDLGVVHGIDCAVAKMMNNPMPPQMIQNPGGGQQQVQLPAPGSNQVLIPVPANTPGAIKVGNMAFVSGLGNKHSMSGLGNKHSMSGGVSTMDNDPMRQEFESVRSLGL